MASSNSHLIVIWWTSSRPFGIIWRLNYCKFFLSILNISLWYLFQMSFDLFLLISWHMSPNFVRKMADLVLPHYDFHHFHFLKVFFSVQKSRSYSNLPMAALFIVESTKSKMADLVLPPPPIILPHYGFHDFLQLFLFGDTARLLAGGTSSSSSTSSPIAWLQDLQGGRWASWGRTLSRPPCCFRWTINNSNHPENWIWKPPCCSRCTTQTI